MRGLLRELPIRARLWYVEPSRAPRAAFGARFEASRTRRRPASDGGPRWFPVFGALSRLCG